MKCWKCHTTVINFLTTLGGADNAPLVLCTPANPIQNSAMVSYYRARETMLKIKMKEEAEMSGAQLAHFLKQVGKGSELTGIGTVYRAGWLVGAGQMLIAIIATHGLYQLGKYGYEKLAAYLREHAYTGPAGEVA